MVQVYSLRQFTCKRVFCTGKCSISLHTLSKIIM